MRGNYGLVWAFVFLWIGSWILHFIFQWREYVRQEQESNEAVEAGEFANQFLARTFENWQSEFLQVLSMVVLTMFLIAKGSAESRDSDDRLEAKVDRILDAVQSSESKK